MDLRISISENSTIVDKHRPWFLIRTRSNVFGLQTIVARKKAHTATCLLKALPVFVQWLFKMHVLMKLWHQDRRIHMQVPKKTMSWEEETRLETNGWIFVLEMQECKNFHCRNERKCHILKKEDLTFKFWKKNIPFQAISFTHTWCVLLHTPGRPVP